VQTVNLQIRSIENDMGTLIYRYREYFWCQ